MSGDYSLGFAIERMSRCFPFTPPGCVRKGVNTGASLIESIKLQNAEKSLTNRKKKKTCKEEREKLGDIFYGKVRSVGDQKTHEYERRKAGVKRKHSQNGNEQVERSDLTEEHGQPIYFQNPVYLSDSTQSSDKIKNDSTLLNHSDHLKKRRVIHFCFRINPDKQSDRKKETVEKQNSSSAKRPDEAVHESNRGEHCSGESKSDDSINKCKVELPCLATGNPQISTRGDDKACSTSTNRIISHKNGVEALGLQYKNLIDCWSPERLQSVVDNVDNVDWLFGTTQPEGPSSNSNLKRHRAPTMDQTCRSASLWPRAQYLPEVGIYALPYSLPY